MHTKNSARGLRNEENDNERRSVSRDPDQASGSGQDENGAIADGMSKTQELAGKAAERIADGASEAYSAAQEKAEAMYRATADASSRGYRKARYASNAAGRNIEAYFEENPMMIAAIGFVGGMILGTVLPRTDREDRYLGEWRDEVFRQGLSRGGDVVDAVTDRVDQGLGQMRH